MNIITPDNYEVIKKDILKWAATSIKDCNIVVNKIMDKVCTEKKYTKLYAKLCDFMIKDDRLRLKTEDEEEKY